MAIAMIFGCTSIMTNAQTDIDINNEITFIYEENTPDYIKEKIAADFTGETSDVAVAGLTCTLFGHNLDTGTVTTITHKVSATAPRCLDETFNYEICSRCDYSNYTRISMGYIYCCS